MNKLNCLIITGITIIALSCTGKTSGGGGAEKHKDKHIADTGYTGTKNYYKSKYKVKDSEFKNGIREGMTRTYYKGGVIEQEIMYSNNVKNGESRWYYPDGKLFRKTPYENDTINGAQIQYYKDGRIKARINYLNGRRVPQIEEYTKSGALVTGYPDVTYRVQDEYGETGLYKIFIEMSDLSENVKYYRGDFQDGLVDITSCKQLLQTATTGYLDLRKTEGYTAGDSVTVIAAYLTSQGNRIYYRIAIPIPYKDLK